MSLINLTPEFGRLESQMNRLFNDYFGDLHVASRGHSGASRWKPVIDVHETDKEYLVNAELPGVKKENINLDLHDNALVISGEAKQDNNFQEGNVYVQERRYGSFSRTIGLPNNINTDAVSAKFNDGVLEVTIPKAEEVQPKKVEIS